MVTSKVRFKCSPYIVLICAVRLAALPAVGDAEAHDEQISLSVSTSQTLSLIQDVRDSNSRQESPRTEKAAGISPSQDTGPGQQRDLFQESIDRAVGELSDFFSLSHIILSLVVFVIAYAATRFVTLLLPRLGRRVQPRASRLRKSVPVVNFVIWFVAFWFVTVGIFGQSPLSVLIIMAAIGLAAAFAAHHLLRDIAAGLIILLERPFQLGDRIRIGGHCGEVAQIGLRSFHLSTSDGSVVVIPNSEITTESVANISPGTLESQVSVEMLVSPETNVDLIKRIAYDAAVVSPYICIKKPVQIDIEEEYVERPMFKLIVKAYVFDSQYERDLRTAILTSASRAFRTAGIEMTALPEGNAVRPS